MLGMAQAGDNLGFALKALPPRFVVREMVRKYLDGDRTVEARVPRPIYRAHPAGANGREEFKGTQPEALRQRPGYGELYPHERRIHESAAARRVSEFDQLSFVIPNRAESPVKNLLPAGYHRSTTPLT